MSNVLLVDTSFSSGPIYQFLINSGHNVAVVGNNPNDTLAKSAETYVHLDYSDVDKLRNLISDRRIDYLVPGCNDLSYMVCSQINDEERFPGIDSLETAEIINNKEKFRAFADQHMLPTPRVLIKEEIGTRWPVIVKPVDAFSGRGVTIIQENNRDEVNNILNRARQASRTNTCIVEDYVEGQLFSHTAFIQSGQILLDYIVEEHGTANPFVVDTSRVINDFPVAILEKIRADIKLIASKLLFQDGLVHTQFIQNENQYWLIEITRRCPGDLYSQLIELSTGFNYAENYTRPFIGLQLKLPHKKHHKWIMRHTVSQPSQCIFGALSIKLPLMIQKLVPICLAGDILRPSPYGRVAILFCEEETEARLNEIFSATLKRQLYSVEPK